MDPKAQCAAVDCHRHEGELVVALSGIWEMERGLPQAQFYCNQFLLKDPPRSVRFELGGLGPWDSGLLAFIVRVTETCKRANIPLDKAGLPEKVLKLLALAQSSAGESTVRAKPETNALARFGAWCQHQWAEFLLLLDFVGQCARSFGRLFAGQAQVRWRDFWLILEDCTVKSLPITLMIAFLVGLVIAFLGAVVLVRFGADVYIPYLVGYGMLREMGAIMTGIIIAGRTGAAFAAEIANMKTTEEIDALKTLGISPYDFLVLPRMISLFLSMPLLVIFANLVGIFGGYLVCVSLVRLAPELYIQGLNFAASPNDFWLGVVKGTAFGVLVAIAGCHRGMQSGSGSDAVGQAATAAVVLGITLIISANALIDWIAASLNI